MAPITVEGRFISPTQIELAHPVVVTDPTVEIEIRPRTINRKEALLALIERMAAFPPGNRTKEDIDRQVQEERLGWEHRR